MQSQYALQYKPECDQSEVLTIPASLVWEWPRPLPRRSPQSDTRDPSMTYLGYSVVTINAMKSLGEIEHNAATKPTQSVTHSRMSPIATMAMALSGFAAVGSFAAFGQFGVIVTGGIVAIVAITLGLRDGKRLQ